MENRAAAGAGVSGGTTASVAGSCGAFGAEVTLGKDGLSRITGPAIRLDHAAQDFEKLRSNPPSYYLDKGRVGMMIEATRLIKGEVGDEMAVVGWTQGPFQGVMALFATNPLLSSRCRD